MTFSPLNNKQIQGLPRIARVYQYDVLACALPVLKSSLITTNISVIKTFLEPGTCVLSQTILCLFPILSILLDRIPGSSSSTQYLYTVVGIPNHAMCTWIGLSCVPVSMHQKRVSTI